MAKSNIKFLNKISNEEVETYMSRCRAFVYAGIEDFGIAPVEAMASGAPVIAFGKGGILDTVNCYSNKSENKIPNGILFKRQRISDIFDTISWFDDKKIWKKFNPEILNNYARNYDTKNFLDKINLSINSSLERFHNLKLLN